MQASSFQIALASLSACLTLPCSLNAAAAEKPNIIFIMADDLGYGDLNAYGQKLIETPHLNRLASEGIRFTQAYSGSPVCAPSRSVLMTGQNAGHATVRGNFGKHGVVGATGEEGRVPLASADITIAEVLKEAGYTTGMIGKWGLGESRTTGEPNDQGFDEWFGYLNQKIAHHYYPDHLWKNKERFELVGNKDGQRGVYSHDLFTDAALAFIKQHRDRPFFLYLPYTLPHSDYDIPDLGVYAEKPWTEDEKTYAAMVGRLDRDVGRVIELLRELGLEKNTIVFFTSDNGAAERWDGRFDSSGPLRGKKRDLYEGGIRVPMIVWWPEKIKPNINEEAVWYFPDVLPTLAELAGTSAPFAIDGLSIADILTGRRQHTGDRFLYWEFFEAGFQQAVRWKNWKAIRFAPGLPLELFDLENDEGESRNVSKNHPDVVARIEEYLKNARTDSINWPVEHGSQ